MEDSTTKQIAGCALIAFIVLLACGIAIGIGARSFWVGTQVTWALGLNTVAVLYYLAKKNVKGYFWGGLISGAWLIYLFAIYGEFNPWWWGVAWLLVAFSHAVVGIRAREHKEPFHGMIAGVMALLSMGVVLAGSAKIAEYLGVQAQTTQTIDTNQATVPAAAQQITQPAISPTPPSPATMPAPTATPIAAGEPPAARTKLNVAAGWQALAGFLLAAFKSIWGIFHLIGVSLLGYSWFRRSWGAMVLPVALLIGVWVAGGLSSPVSLALTHVISSSPAGWMRDLLRFSVANFGHAGWGTVLLGLTVMLILLPTLRQIAVAQYRLKNVPAIQRLLGTTIAYEYMQQSAVSPVLMMTGYIIYSAIAFGLFIALWVGLRQIAQAGEIPLAAWGIPDLSVPSWKPVWQWPYFALAGLYALTQIIRILPSRKFHMQTMSGIPGNNAWYILIGTLILALFVPAGVILFLIGQAIAQWLVVPLMGREILKLPADEKKRGTEEAQQKEEGLQGLQRELQTLLEKERPPELAGTDVWHSPAPLIFMREWAGALWGLTERGDLIIYDSADGSVRNIPLPIRKGQAIFALKEPVQGGESQALVIGNGTEVLWVGLESRSVVKKVALSRQTHAWALNPYKTMLAWVAVSDGIVGGLFLEPGREVVFAEGLDLEPTLAFSQDGRYLALGGSAGTIRLLDIASRQITRMLTLPEDSLSHEEPVRFLFGRQGGGWLSIYQDRRIVLWNADGSMAKEMRPNRRINAVDFHVETDRLAVGLSGGILQVFDVALQKVFDDKVQEKEITGVSFSQDGRQIFTIGDKTEVRKVSL